MNPAARAALAGLATALLLLASTALADRTLGLHLAARAAREREAADEALRTAFATRFLNLRHFPAGVYVHAAGGTCETWFESPTGELADLYQRLPLPGRGPSAIKLLIRENGQIDFTTRGLLRGASEEERTLVSGRICTQVNENPRVSVHADDPDARDVHRAIVEAMKSAVTFRDERVALVDRPGTPPLILVEEEGETFAELGDRRIVFIPAGGALKVAALRAVEGTGEGSGETGEVRLPPVAPGDRAAVVTVKRAMVNESVVGTVIPRRARGFHGPLDLLVGIDNTERITGIVVMRHRESPAAARRALARDAEFLRRFDGLLANDIGLRGDPGGGIVEAVTGATRTCRGVAAAVREALHFNETMNLEEYGSEE